MSRSGYTEDWGWDDQWRGIRWRGAVASAIRGKRGQALLIELLAALDAMPVKELIVEELVDKEGQVCTLGALGVARGLDMEKLDPSEHEVMGKVFGIAPAMVQEIEWYNDEGFLWDITPASRWRNMRDWVARKIKQEELAG